MTTDIFEFSHNMSVFANNALLGVGLGFSLIPRPCAFVACSTKFTQRAWACSSRDVCRSLRHGHFTENQ